MVFVVQFNTEMDKREYAYAYIVSDHCICRDNPSLLLNRSFRIDMSKAARLVWDMGDENSNNSSTFWNKLKNDEMNTSQNLSILNQLVPYLPYERK